MSKDRREQPEALSSTIPPPKAETERAEGGTDRADKLYAPEKREKTPAKLTAGQYLKTANVNGGIGGLVLSMYGNKIMSFAEWETLVKTLLKRPVK
jgi:hypothetical protein